MGIRISDQPSDQHTQNPPPDQEAALGEPQSKTVESVTATPPNDAPPVLRGAHSLPLCLVEQVQTASLLHGTTGTCGAGLSVKADDCPSVQLSSPVLGWVRRDTGATQRIGTAEDHIIRKLPPRWTIAPVGAGNGSTPADNGIHK